MSALPTRPSSLEEPERAIGAPAPYEPPVEYTTPEPTEHTAQGPGATEHQHTPPKEYTSDQAR